MDEQRSLGLFLAGEKDPGIFQHADEQDDVGWFLKRKTEEVVVDDGDIREVSGARADYLSPTRVAFDCNDFARRFAEITRDGAATGADFQHPLAAQILGEGPQQVRSLGGEVVLRGPVRDRRAPFGREAA